MKKGILTSLEISKLYTSIIQVIALNIQNENICRDSYNSTNIKPILDCGLWFGKSIRSFLQKIIMVMILDWIKSFQAPLFVCFCRVCAQTTTRPEALMLSIGFIWFSAWRQLFTINLLKNQYFFLQISVLCQYTVPNHLAMTLQSFRKWPVTRVMEHTGWSRKK